MASPVRVRVCVTSWVSVSLPGRAGEKAPASRKLQDVCPRREGDPPPFPLRERCHGAAAEVLFLGGGSLGSNGG